jgi:hypothetical protein
MLMSDTYVRFEWIGSEEAENGVAIFSLIGCERLEVELTHFGAAHKIYERMQKIAIMAFEDGQQDIKQKVKNL